MNYKILSSPVGKLKLVVQDGFLRAILWENEKLNRACLDEMSENPNDPFLMEVEKQLQEYFKNQRTEFALPIKPIGTPFQEAVWKALEKIPYGSTCSYKDIAQRINRPKAVRAVGTAIGRNPIPIIIPCHRVIGSNGSLTGFAGGLDRKETLLTTERH